METFFNYPSNMIYQDLRPPPPTCSVPNGTIESSTMEATIVLPATIQKIKFCLFKKIAPCFLRIKRQVSCKRRNNNHPLK